MLTDIAIRSSSATRLSVEPEPIGLAYVARFGATDAKVEAEGWATLIEPDPGPGSVSGRFPEVVFPPPTDWTNLQGAAAVLVSNPCPGIPAEGLQLKRYDSDAGEWVLAPLKRYDGSVWITSPLKLYRDGEWQTVETAT